MSAQEVLNTVWYRFALYTAKRVGRWANYTTGELYDLPELRYNARRGRIETAQVYQFYHVGQSQMRLQCKNRSSLAQDSVLSQQF